MSVPSRAIRVEADAVRMAQVLNNLLDNAGKYTEEGGRIWLGATLEAGGGAEARGTP